MTLRHPRFRPDLCLPGIPDAMFGIRFWFDRACPYEGRHWEFRPLRDSRPEAVRTAKPERS